MNEIDLKELFKVPVETLWEKTIRSLLEADITYQNNSENEGIAELDYLQLDLTEEQREVCNRLLECWDKDDCEFLIAGKLSFIYHGMKQLRVPNGIMRHIPYRYRIENGRAVIDEE